MLSLVVAIEAKLGVKRAEARRNFGEGSSSVARRASAVISGEINQPAERKKMFEPAGWEKVTHLKLAMLAAITISACDADPSLRFNNKAWKDMRMNDYDESVEEMKVKRTHQSPHMRRHFQETHRIHNWCEKRAVWLALTQIRIREREITTILNHQVTKCEKFENERACLTLR